MTRKDRKPGSILFMHIKWPYLLCIFFFCITAFYIFYPGIENFFVFFPDKTIDITPDDFRLNHRDVFFTTEDGEKLNGWFFPISGEKSYPVILFFHGNAGNISHRLENIRLILQRNIQVFIFDYRGYGKSTGKPSESGLYLDGLAAYDYLVTEESIPPEDIILFGRSLGAAAAVETASKRAVRSVIVESAFLSTRDMAKTIPLFNLFAFFMPQNYNNLQKVRNLNLSKLFIHGDRDEIVPFSMGEKLFREAAPPKYFLRVEGAGHNDTYITGGDDYFRILADFVNNPEFQ